MEKTKILIDGIEKDVFGIFYVYNSNYYFVYTEKELEDENYAVLYMTKVGKETKNTENGLVETGYMIGVQIDDPDEQKNAQTSFSYIVEDKKNNTQNPLIQYLPISMLSNLKIIGKKKIKLLKSILEEKFNLVFETENIIDNNTLVEVPEPVTPVVELPTQPVEVPEPITPVVELPTQPVEIPEPVTPVVELPTPIGNVMEELNSEISMVGNTDENNVIIDYRAKYFELEEKNKELQIQVEELTRKINEIKKVIE